MLASEPVLQGGAQPMFDDTMPQGRHRNRSHAHNMMIAQLALKALGVVSAECPKCAVAPHATDICQKPEMDVAPPCATPQYPAMRRGC